MPRSKRSEIKFSFHEGDLQVSVDWPKGANTEEMANVIGLMSVGALLHDVMHAVMEKANINGEEDQLDNIAEIVDGYLMQNEEMIRQNQRSEEKGPVVSPLHLTQHLMNMGGRIE